MYATYYDGAGIKSTVMIPGAVSVTVDAVNTPGMLSNAEPWLATTAPVRIPGFCAVAGKAEPAVSEENLAGLPG